MEVEKYRIVTFNADECFLIDISKLPENLLTKILPMYFINTRYITKDNEVTLHTSIILIPVKKFRKNETVVEIMPGIELGLDDDY